MTASAVQAIKNEIEHKQAEIDALKIALAALGGVAPAKSHSVRRARRPLTEAEKRALSKAMKAAWRRRKTEKAASAKGQKTAAKKSKASATS
jgi:hypothetical protein